MSSAGPSPYHAPLYFTLQDGSQTWPRRDGRTHGQLARIAADKRSRGVCHLPPNQVARGQVAPQILLAASRPGSGHLQLVFFLPTSIIINISITISITATTTTTTTTTTTATATATAGREDVDQPRSSKTEDLGGADDAEAGESRVGLVDADGCV
jgi:hypothetical protein